MGLTIILEDEDGVQVHALNCELYVSSEDLYDNDFKLLKYVDLFGDTTFNSLQLDDLLDDLHRMKSLFPNQSILIQEIMDLAGAAKSKTHTYLKFYGD